MLVLFSLNRVTRTDYHTVYKKTRDVLLDIAHQSQFEEKQQARAARKTS